jgi:hypothetical protein
VAALEQLVRDHGPDVARATRDEQLHQAAVLAARRGCGASSLLE